MLDLHIAHDPPSGGVPWKELLPLAPHLFWAIVALVVLLVIGPATIRALLSRVTKLSFAGFEFQLQSEIDEVGAARDMPIAPKARNRLARRLARSRHLLECVRILWVDDRPVGNAAEMTLLRSLCVTIDFATSTEEARIRLGAGVYDLILSDMTRGGQPQAGLALLPDLDAAPLRPPIIFYVGAPTPTPEGAFGLTQAPDELFHLLLDALERRRG